MTIKDGRQWATSLAEIRRDHVERYRWASGLVKGLVADLGCGIGYGAQMMASAGCFVDAFDASEDAISFAEQHWHHKDVRWTVRDLSEWRPITADWAVAFEIIEHLKDPRPLLSSLKTKKLLASVPNEAVMPFDPVRHSYHHRHYTKDEFNLLLSGGGWIVEDWFTQAGKHSPVTLGSGGMTLIAECRR